MGQIGDNLPAARPSNVLDEPVSLPVARQNTVAPVARA